jgi:hypothetical protein
VKDSCPPTVVYVYACNYRFKMALSTLLQNSGLYTSDVQDWLTSNCCQTADDLAYAFEGTEQLMRIAPFMAEAWCLAAQHKSDDIDLTRRVRAVRYELLRAEQRCAPPPMPRPRKVKTRTFQRKNEGVKDERAADKDRRRQAAEQAVQLSLSWAPERGVAKGIERTSPLILAVRAAQVKKLSLFEPKGVLLAVRDCQLFEAWLAEQLPRGVSKQARQVLLDTYIQSGDAATGPLAMWNRMAFIDTHLAGEYNTKSLSKPKPTNADSGEVKEVEQAVAAPPELYWKLELCLAELIRRKDWRRMPVACTLEGAYSMVRPTHMNRTTMLHRACSVYWCEAFRGKGKRQGARRGFKYALVRHGVTGIDIGGVIHTEWDKWSRSAGFPLAYIMIDPRDGSMMSGTKVINVIRDLAEEFLPNPDDASLLVARSWRRYGGTMVQVMRTSPTEAVALGGWAGVPELAKMVPDTKDIILAWKKSMPHLYSDRKLEQEELQKLAHVRMMYVATEAVKRSQGTDKGVSWQDVEEVLTQTDQGGNTLLQRIKAEATQWATELRSSDLEPLYCSKVFLRRQFAVEAKQPEANESSGIRKKAKIDIESLMSIVTKKTANQPEEAVAVPQEEEVAKERPPPKPDVEDVWFWANKTRYIHKRCPSMTGWYPACMKAHARETKGAVDDQTLKWTGNKSEAAAIGRAVCPDKACRL